MKDEALYIWTIYEKGTNLEYPHNYTAVRFEVKAGEAINTGRGLVGSLEYLRDQMRQRGFQLIGRQTEDDATILESWI